MLCEKISLSLINIFCPPLAVFLIAGPGTDVIVNSFLFLLAVLPSHVHSFYLTTVYFYRKRKVRKGLPPGGKKPMIWSRRVLSGGASMQQVQDLQRGNSVRVSEKRDLKDQRRRSRRRRRRSRGGVKGMFGGRRHAERDSMQGGDGVQHWMNEQRLDDHGTTTSSPISPVLSNSSSAVQRLYSHRSMEQSPPLPQRRLTGMSSIEARPPLPQRTRSSRVEPAYADSEWESLPNQSQHPSQNISTAGDRSWNSTRLA
jgi:uncharacterized membrane protein YqaE (UPF0057 family)